VEIHRIPVLVEPSMMVATYLSLYGGNMRFCAFLMLAASLAFTMGCGKKDGGASASNDQDKLQGVWKVVEFDSGSPGEGMPKEIVEKMRLAFKGDKLYFFESAEEFQPASYVVDVKQDPRHLNTIKLDDKGQPQKSIDFKDGKMSEGPAKADLGIYKFDGDKLVVAMGDNSNRPKDFKAVPEKKPEPGKAFDFKQPTVTVVTLMKTGEVIPEFKQKEKTHLVEVPVPPLPKITATPDSKLPLPDIKLPVPDIKLPVPDIKLPTPPEKPDASEKK